jgi:DNA-binding MarR family transcriptional regulator
MCPTENSGDTAVASTTLDLLIHEAARLKVVAVLNEAESADFNYLLSVTGLTRGNLSTHMAKLVKGGYVEEHKEFVERKPHTDYILTAAGKKAYRQYLKAWRNLTKL